VLKTDIGNGSVSFAKYAYDMTFNDNIPLIRFT